VFFAASVREYGRKYFSVGRASLCCHSERSEESLIMGLVQRTKKYSEMFRFAQHDRNEISN
jgi:hypothetical protein